MKLWGCWKGAFCWLDFLFIIIIIIIIIVILFLIVFRGWFLYLKLISYILLSYSVFAISMLILRDWNFPATSTVMFLQFYHE